MVERAAKKSSAGFGEMIVAILQAVALALVIRTLLFQPFSIPSGSMMPTLLVGDYVLVTKWSYGYTKYSLPLSPNLFEGRIWASEPERGDVLVFRKPSETDVDFIKRLIGLPGDRVQMRDGVLYINGTAVPREPEGFFVEGNGVQVPQYRETLPNGVTYLTLDKANTMADNTREFVVPAGHYFMMGDNRDNSDDSRGSVGYVPFENLIGKAQLIFFSIDGDWALKFWKWPEELRLNRFFTWIR
ncbi:signal peptidase I [Aureimonas fodinaquatilis]|uniref:Signal peptidase I n=1 Tax=Aureimonas fodinaquatilis TaxID=2565783 RepID=A0A5B0DZQ9_9HYPH|nr:signal peptidase I [Aureimonas fodinaquatilis]KAA0971030.1 signal peptidase I [Aureimonas fodinaquatilis]